MGVEQGRFWRPYLIANNELMGMGQFVVLFEHLVDYCRGYLCGLICGDGTIGIYFYDHPNQAHSNVHRFQLALTDFETLRRAQLFLSDAGIATNEFVFDTTSAKTRPMQTIHTQTH